MIAILFIILIIAIIIGIPIGFSVGISTMVYLFFEGFPPVSIIAQRMVDGVNSFSLLALPLFILSGSIMAYGSTPRLMRLANLILGRIPGGLAAATSVGCGFFGAISGSGVATTAAIGGIMEPEMVKNDYDKGFTAALVAGAGVLGMVIPPSFTMVVYAESAATSIGKLFFAGIIPGFLAVFFFVLLSVFLGKKRGYIGVKDDSLTFSDKAKIFLDALLPLIMPVIILGGVVSGMFTPTESAAVAVVYSFLLSIFVYKEMKIKDIIDVCIKTVITSSMILFIISAASPFGWVLAIKNVPQLFANAVLAITNSSSLIYLLITVILLFLGAFMEGTSIVILTTPIFLPIVTQLGMDPIHFGIILMLSIAVGGTTPPLAVNLFVSTEILNINIEETFPDIIYIVAIMVIALLLVLFIPQLSMYLPSIL